MCIVITRHTGAAYQLDEVEEERPEALVALHRGQKRLSLSPRGLVRRQRLAQVVAHGLSWRHVATVTGHTPPTSTFSGVACMVAHDAARKTVSPLWERAFRCEVRLQATCLQLVVQLVVQLGQINLVDSLENAVLAVPWCMLDDPSCNIALERRRDLTSSNLQTGSIYAQRGSCDGDARTSTLMNSFKLFSLKAVGSVVKRFLRKLMAVKAG